MRLYAFPIVMALGAVAVVTAPGVRADTLTVTNGDFHLYSNAPPGSFGYVNPTGWTSGAAGPGGSLIYVTNAAGINAGNYLYVNGPAGGQASPSNPFPAPPPGGNFVEADANPYYGNSFSYALSGLSVGTTYQLSFYQAGGQQPGFGDGRDTTEQWIVSLGTAGLNVSESTGPYNSYYGGNASVYSNPDSGASIVASPLMTTPSDRITPWQQVTVNLTADATSDVLSFLAWGDDGVTANLPPIAFLDIAENGQMGPPTAPAPASLTLLATGMLGIGAYRLRRRARLATI